MHIEWMKETTIAMRIRNEIIQQSSATSTKTFLSFKNFILFCLRCFALFCFCCWCFLMRHKERMWTCVSRERMEGTGGEKTVFRIYMKKIYPIKMILFYLKTNKQKSVVRVFCPAWFPQSLSPKEITQTSTLVVNWLT